MKSYWSHCCTCALQLWTTDDLISPPAWSRREPAPCVLPVEPKRGHGDIPVHTPCACIHARPRLQATCTAKLVRPRVEFRRTGVSIFRWRLPRMATGSRPDLPNILAIEAKVVLPVFFPETASRQLSRIPALSCKISIRTGDHMIVG